MDRDQFPRPLLVFDGDCGFCRVWVDYWKGLTSDRVNYAPFQEVGERFPQASREQFASAVKLILPGGEVRSGAHAVFTALASVPDRRWMLWSYDRVPGVGPLCEAAYRTIANWRVGRAYSPSRDGRTGREPGVIIRATPDGDWFSQDVHAYGWVRRLCQNCASFIILNRIVFHARDPHEG